MKRSRDGVFVIVLQGAVLLAGLFAAASTAPDEKAKSQQHDPGNLTQSLNGADIYRAHCASCHGLQGKGDGPVAAALTTKMPDLSTISQRSGGVFPVARVRKVISGDEVILGHGTTGNADLGANLPSGPARPRLWRGPPAKYHELLEVDPEVTTPRLSCHNKSHEPCWGSNGAESRF